MFDKFEPFQGLQKQNFAFQPTRYETWVAGKMVSSGRTNSIIYANVVQQDGTEKVEVTFNDQTLNTELSQKNIFDEFVTATDRLQLIVIPEETNVENVAIMMFKMTIGATRKRKNFINTEPFCCNLFLQSGTIAKITFSFSNPEKLIEFYNDSEIDYNSNKSEDIFDSFRNSFQKLRKKVLDLPLNMRFRCDVYKIDGEKLINNEKGNIRVSADEIILETYDNSGDFIVFYDNNDKLFCKYVVMNGQIIVNEAFEKVEFESKGMPNVSLIFEVSANSDQTKKEGKHELELDFVFKSSDHLRYENGEHISGPHGGAGRAVKVEPNINGGEGVTVTLYNLDGNHPVWQNNVQMAPKQMKVIESNNDKVVLRGYGQDAMGASFADYGLTINLKNGQIYNCVLHMHDRGVDIEYLP